MSWGAGGGMRVCVHVCTCVHVCVCVFWTRGGRHTTHTHSALPTACLTSGDEADDADGHVWDVRVIGNRTGAWVHQEDPQAHEGQGLQGLRHVQVLRPRLVHLKPLSLFTSHLSLSKNRKCTPNERMNGPLSFCLFPSFTHQKTKSTNKERWI